MSSINKFQFDNSVLGGILATIEMVGGSKDNFFSWIETRQLYATILEQLKVGRLYGDGVQVGIRALGIELNLDKSAVINKPEDLPVELLFEFLKQYIMQEGWKDIDEHGNLKQGVDIWQSKQEKSEGGKSLP